ncbi:MULTISPECIES: polysaccharide deacetylase family protein [Paenibacillus]|uniref:polysaccharide deacetylase family protein n=1 Tax=Paenibacillus TaxID=44249 RepID=UPI002FE1B7C3
MLMLRCPRSRQPERAYAARVLLEELLGLPFVLEWEDRDDVELRVAGASAHEARLLLADVLLGMTERKWLRSDSLPREPLARLDVEGLGSLPVIYGEPLGGERGWQRAGGGPEAEGQLIREEAGGRVLRCGVDLFGSSFFMLTRYEELAIPDRDYHGRFPVRASLAFREGFLDIPVVNAYAELLWSLLLRLWPGLEGLRRQRQVRKVVSHDVDHPFFAHRRRGRFSLLKEAAADAVKRRDFEAAWKKSRLVPWAAGGGDRVRDMDPYNTFRWLMERSERAGVRSSFYFIPEQTDARYDEAYTLNDPEIAGLLRTIHARGHEIGLHPGYGTYLSPPAIRRQFELLRQGAEAAGVRQDAWGGRQHFLRWRAPDTWQSWEEAGLDYDSSLGYPDSPGFRCGICREYPVFNLLTRQMLKLRERPLVVMEQTVRHPEHGGDRSEARAFEQIRRYYRQCARYGGDFTLLWHNSELVHEADRRLYRKCLDELS